MGWKCCIKYCMKNKSLWFLFFSVLLIILFILSLKQGYVNLTFKQFIKVILGNHPDQLFHDIVFLIRLPRALTAILIGALLSVAGCVTQATLRNDLAEPYLLGISSGAAFGAALAIVSGFYAVTGMAFFFAIMALLIVILCAAPSRFSILSIILSGVMVNTFFTTAVMFLMQITTGHEKSMMFWLLGDLAHLPFKTISDIATIFFVVTLILVFFAKGLDLFTLRDDEIKSLGKNPSRLRFFYLMLSSLLVAYAVSNVGVIGFLGLVVPHLARSFVGTNHKVLLPFSALLGAVLLLTADLLAHMTPLVLPVGLITALIGAPLFLRILAQKKYN